MRRVETRISVPQNPDQVWSVLTDYASYSQWNSFMCEASGEVAVGKKLRITLCRSSDRKFTFSPKLLVVNRPDELRWLGVLFFKSLFNGQHYWLLTRNSGGGTDIVHREDFSGLLVGVFFSDKSQMNFERMNRDMAAELERRYPVSAISNSTQ